MSSESPSSLSAAQRRLLEQRMRRRAGAPGQPHSGIAHASREQPLPLSFGQERFWLLQHLEPDATVYNSAYLYRLRGDLNRAALEIALNRIVRRHEILRTVIASDDRGNARQIIREPDAVTLTLEVTRAPDLADAQTRANATARERFDLARDLPLRARLFQFGPDDHLLLLVAHHSVWDATSTRVFWQELAAYYPADGSGESAKLPSLDIHYADFAAWQRARLQGPELQRLLDFWRPQLEDAPPLALPGDHPRPAELSYAGDVLEFTWPADLRDSLHAFARATNTSLFMVLLAGWSTLLHRLSGAETVITGTAVAGRNRRELEPLIGFFVNMLALRADFSANPGFRTLLEQIRQRTLAAYDHDELPFEKLVAELRVPRDPARHPIFQTALVLHPPETDPPWTQLANVEVSALPRPVTGARFDLSLTFAETPAGLRGSLEFSTDLFDHPTMDRWVRHLETLLRAAVAQPETPIDALPLLTREEREQLLGAWSGSPAPYPRDATVHELVAAHAKNTPAAIALILGSTRITYAELDARVGERADQLRALGVARGDFVAIELERSVEFVVCVLAILQTGAAYVPLLCDLPGERRRFILEDTRARVLICAGEPAGEVLEEMRVFSVGPDLASGSQHLPPRSSAVPAPRGQNASETGRIGAPTDAAYVMYTSGSTGRPKGVIIPHRGIVRLVRGQTPSAFKPGDRFLLLSSLAFDASTFEMWSPLLNGATLAIFPARWPEFDPLARAVREHAITHLFLTAGLFNQVVDHRPEILDGVTHVLTGGEAMSARHASRLRELRPDLQITNCYGPTEITTYTVSHTFRGAPAPDEPWPGGNVPIGRPTPNARCYVLDPRGEPVPIGVPGELFLGGDGIALGYLNLPELTAERFVPDPFADQSDARMYRTGDRARWRADGLLEFLGRFDDQVKIRGFRIEPGEIEAVLAQQSGVRDAAVVVREDRRGEPRLVGYVVAQEGRTIDGSDLRGQLAERLPDYMVPSVVVPISRLPTTPNGKLDRRALPAPDTTPPAATRRAAARTPTEQIVSDVWRAALGEPSFGVHDDFFALGGHSLLAMQATAQLGARLGRTIPLRWWFDHPTIAGLAERIDRERGGTDRPITRVSRAGDLPLSHEERRLWFLQHVLPDPATYHVTWGCRLRGDLDHARFRCALERLIARHEILRTGYVERAGQPARLIEPIAAAPLRIESAPPSESAIGDLILQRQLLQEVRQPFVLHEPPLWRVLVLTIGPNDHVVVFTAHHLICDEWSFPVLHREIAALYAADDASLATPPDLPVQYADYAAWQQLEVAHDAGMQRAREFWLEHLHGAPGALNWPQPFKPASHPLRGTGDRLAFDPSPEDALALERLGNELESTPFVAWLALFAVMLARSTGQNDLVIGTPLAQRNRAELQSLIGFFLNTLPLRVRLTPGTDFRTFLRHVRGEVLEAFTHGALPLDEIVAAHGGARAANGRTLFNVMFVVHDETPPILELPGMRAEVIELGTGTAKADLTWFVTRRENRPPRISLEFSRDVFTPAAVDRLIRDFEAALKRFTTAPESVVLETTAAIASAPVRSTMPNESTTAVPGTSSTPAPAGIERELLAIWRRVLQRDAIGPHDDFFAIGGHSLLAMQLSHEIQQHFARPMSLADLLATPTIAGLASLLAAETSPHVVSATNAAWKGTGDGVPYFHIPGMTGVEFLPSAVGRRLGPDRRWFDGLQHPGADGRVAPANSLEDLAADLVRQIRAIRPRGPYALGGFCHGGLVAYEVARQLERQGETVAALVLWDTFPCLNWRTRPPGAVARFLRARLFGPRAGLFLRDRMRFVAHRISLGAQVVWRTIRARLPGDRGRLEARMITAGMRARRRYQPGTFHGSVLLVRSRDERVLVEKLPLDGWAGAMLGPCERADLDHWHFDLMREPAVSELAERTAAFLRRIDRV